MQELFHLRMGGFMAHVNIKRHCGSVIVLQTISFEGSESKTWPSVVGILRKHAQTLVLSRHETAARRHQDLSLNADLKCFQEFKNICGLKCNCIAFGSRESLGT